MSPKNEIKGTGSRLSAYSLIKLLLSNLLLILSVNNSTHMYLSDCIQSNLKWDGGVLKSQKELVDYANTTNLEFTVDPKVLFHG